MYAGRGWLDVRREPHLHDSQLLADEVSRLALSRTELVVLAVCDSTAGEVSFSDDRFDLSRALLQAGAGAVWGTQWKFPTPSTAAVASPPRCSWRPSTGSTSRRRAGWCARMTPCAPPKAELRDQGYRPDVWAAWVIVGDGR